MSIYSYPRAKSPSPTPIPFNTIYYKLYLPRHSSHPAVQHLTLKPSASSLFPFASLSSLNKAPFNLHKHLSIIRLKFPHTQHTHARWLILTWSRCECHLSTNPTSIETILCLAWVDVPVTKSKFNLISACSSSIPRSTTELKLSNWLSFTIWQDFYGLR